MTTGNLKTLDYETIFALTDDLQVDLLGKSSERMQQSDPSLLGQFEFISRRLQNVQLREACGFQEDRWDAPLAVWHAPEGLDAAYPASSHATLTCLHHPARMTRADRPGRLASAVAGPDSLVMYAGGYERHWLCRTDASCDQIYLDLDTIADCGRQVFGLDGVALRDDRPFLEDLPLRRAVRTYVARGQEKFDPPTRLEMDARATLIAIHLVTRYSNGAHSRQPDRHCLGRRHLSTILDRIDAQLDGNLRVSMLAAEAGLGASQFHAAFRRAIGTSPHAYVVERRLARAQDLLRGKKSLSDIALECGFSSQQHFTTVFRRRFGVAPGQWRRAVAGK